MNTIFRRPLVAVALLALLLVTGCGGGDNHGNCSWMLRELCHRAERISEGKEFSKDYEKLLEIIKERDDLNGQIAENRIVETVREDLRIRRADVLTKAQTAVNAFGDRVKHIERTIEDCKMEMSRCKPLDPNHPGDKATLDRLDTAEKRLPVLKAMVAGVEADFALYQEGKPMPASLRK